MDFLYTENNVVIRNCTHFDIEQTFECGQCFRFDKNSDGNYIGVAFGKKLVLEQKESTITLYGVTKEEFEQRWRVYFDIDRDYAGIIKELSFDSRIKTACGCVQGIRILKQDPWEALCSFIISQNNNIPRIKKIIASLCVLLGEPVAENMYSFPEPEKIAGAGLDGLAAIRSGFRAKYIIDAAQKVTDGTVNLEEIPKMSYEEAKKTLMTIKGVGEKVADCALLFGFGFMQAFPKDVWVKKVINEYYGPDFKPDYFGENAGIAQQYLFYYERTISKNIIKDKNR